MFLSILLFSCSPEKKVQRYSYLFENRSPRKQVTSASATMNTGQSSVGGTTTTTTIVTTVKNTPPSAAPIRIEDNQSQKEVYAAAAAPATTNKQMGVIIKTARSYLGTKYKYGGMNRKGIDCSGLVCTAYRSVDRELPRSTTQMAKTGRQVNKRRITVGDLVFFSANNGSRINHVGLVTSTKGNEIEFIHATTSNGVRTDKLSAVYWEKRFRRAVRP